MWPICGYILLQCEYAMNRARGINFILVYEIIDIMCNGTACTLYL